MSIKSFQAINKFPSSLELLILNTHTLTQLDHITYTNKIIITISIDVLFEPQNVTY